MEFLLLYALLAMATSVHSVYELLWPVIWEREKKGLPTEYKYVMYVTFFFVGLIMAPVIFLSCIIPSWGERFRDSLEKGLFPKE